MRRIFLLFIFSSLLFAKNAVEIKVNEPGRLIIEVSIDSVWVSSKDGQIQVSPSLQQYLFPGEPILPHWQEIFIGLPSSANVQIYKGSSTSLDSYNTIYSKEEFAKDDSSTINIEPIGSGHKLNKLISLTAVKDIDGKKATKVLISPCQIINNSINIEKVFTVNITWKPSGIRTKTRLLSKFNTNELNLSRSISKQINNVIPEYQFFPNIAKLTVDSSAWYKITQDDLLSNGIDISGTDLNSIRLWYKESEIPIYIDSNIFNSDVYILFYGYKNPPPEWADYDNNFYTNDNIYWLTWGTGSGMRFTESSVEPVLPENQVQTFDNFSQEIKIESDDKYVFLNRLSDLLFETWDVVDHFFMLPQIIVSGPFDFEFNLDSPDLTNGNTFNFEMELRGMTTSDHDLDVYINKNLIGNTKWSTYDLENKLITNIDVSLLNAGSNTISIELSPQDASAHDLVYLNWYKLSYPRILNTNSDYIKFSNNSIYGDDFEYNVSGLSTEKLFLIKNQNEILNNFNFTNDTLKFQDNISNYTEYEVITKTNLSNPKSIEVVEPINNLLQNTSEEYVIVAPDSFFTILEPLADYHNAKIVDIDDIYRQYSHGILSPYGLKSFLEDAYYSNDNNLKYVLLAMSSDEIDWWNGTFDHIPSIPGMFIFTYMKGAIGCDLWYGAFTNEYWRPDVNIGRFSVNNTEQLQNVVDKTMHHHTRETNYWDNNTLMIGGSDIGFRYQTEALLNNIKDSGNFISRLYVAQSSSDTIFYGTADTLAEHFSRGLSYINFFGHGGGRVWEDNGLLTFSNMSNLNNANKYPFISSMSCHTGDFSYHKALSKQMVNFSNGGALAWYSASGLGWYWNDYYMTVPLQELLFAESDLTISEAINIAKTKYYITYSGAYPEIAGSQVYQYNLIGDPAIKLKNPIYEHVDLSPLDPEQDETVSILTTINSGDSLYYQIFQPDNISENFPQLYKGTQPYELNIPSSFEKGIYDINFAFSASDELYNSSQMFTVSGSYIEILNTEPIIPTLCDSIGVTVKAIDGNGISSVELFVNNQYWSDLESIEDDLFVLTDLIPPQLSGSTINLQCIAVDSNSESTYSLIYPITIGDIPDIIPVSGEFVINDQINIAVDVQSNTSTPVEAFCELSILDGEDWNIIGKDTIFIEGKETQKALFSDFYPAGVNNYRFISVANLSCQSTDITTNDTLVLSLETNAFWVTPEQGTTVDGNNHTIVGFGDTNVEILSGVVDSASILQISTFDEINLTAQPDFEAINVPIDYIGIDISIDSDISMNIEWMLDNSLADYYNKLYKYFMDFNVWLPIDYSLVNDNTARFYTEGSAMFAFIESTDSEKPSLWASINNQTYLKDIYINKNPNISISVYDKNGIDHRKSNIDVGLNGQFDGSFEQTISGTANNLNLELSPTLTSLDSTLSILMKDAAGNISDTFLVSFIVSEKLDILDYGNFPNPFFDKTIFAYELTEAVDDLTIRIYTVEGRRIRKLTDEESVTGSTMNIPGYHEIEWDGKNSDGKTVDFGNYFYQIKAKKGKKIKVKNGKIVRAR